MGIICIGNKRYRVEREEVKGKLVAATHDVESTRTVLRLNKKGFHEKVSETFTRKNVPKIVLIDKCKSHANAIHLCNKESDAARTKQEAAAAAAAAAETERIRAEELEKARKEKEIEDAKMSRQSRKDRNN